MSPVTPQYSLPPKSWYRRWWGIILLIILALFFILGTAVFFQTIDLIKKLKQGEISINDLTGSTTTSSDQIINLATDDDPYLGNPTAPIIIVEFADFNCPSCRQSAPILLQLLKLYPQDLKVIFRDFPITTEQSITAALAGACAHEQGNLIFWGMHDQLFAQQGNLTEENIIAIAQNLGLKMNQFNNCLKNNKYYLEIKEDALTAYQAGAEGTPTFFINGLKVTGSQSLDSWQTAIDYLLNNR